MEEHLPAANSQGDQIVDDLRVEIPIELIEGPLVWSEVFRNDGPVQLEVGFGKGTFLREAARLFPDRNFLGIEYSRKYVRLVRHRLERLGLPNVRIVRAEAHHFFANFLPDESLEAIHIYHPDPWPKRRHHKRRLLKRAFVTTDFEGYYAAIQKEVGALAGQGTSFNVEEAEGPGIIMTNYSRKHLERGGKIFRIEIRKPPARVQTP
jgi:tRNA (guanine-N7-)-methyltransferase